MQNVTVSVRSPGLIEDTHLGDYLNPDNPAGRAMGELVVPRVVRGQLWNTQPIIEQDALYPGGFHALLAKVSVVDS